MAQRVMIGMALVNAPKLLIADEPTTGLDLTIQKQVLDLIAETVRARGLACVLISHDLGVIAAYCSRVAVMFAGAVVETGPVERVFGDPVHPYTRQLLEAAAEDLRQDHALGRHPPPDLYALPAGCAYADRCPLAIAVCAEPVPMTALASGHSFACHVEAARHGR
jgi:peptide/nickel transport system ATP-binding protein/oligopeptide transport system ATP-binding protein